jgi:hypothetical protein
MIDVVLFEKPLEKPLETFMPHYTGDVERRVLDVLKGLEKSQAFFGDGVVALVKLLAREIDNLRAEIEAK